jgi:hypothetical protein
MKVIPTYVHGILDYIFGLALIFAPNIFGFVEVGGAAVFVPQLVGAIIIIQSLATRYELGLFKLIPMRGHLTIDYVAAIFLAISPWLFGFNILPENAWVPHVVVGVLIFLVALFTHTETGDVTRKRTEPRREKRHETRDVPPPPR